MASNRDPRKDYRINRRGRKVTSSADRSKRSKKASAPKPTSSSTRSRGKGTGSKKVTSDKSRATNTGAKVTRRQSSPSTKVRRTNLKLKGTWARERNLDKKFLKDMKSNNLESGLFNDERLKGATDANKERSQRLGGVKQKIVPGPKTKAVRKKPVTGGPRGAQGPRTAPVQGPSRKTPNIVADVPQRTNKPKVSPPTPGVKFNPKNRVPAKPGMKGGAGVLRTMGSAALAGALSAGSLRNPVSKAKEKELRKKEAKAGKKRPMPSMGKDYKKQEKELSRKANASNFDNAFAKARKAGKSSFTWRGKSYNTKLK